MLFQDIGTRAIKILFEEGPRSFVGSVRDFCWYRMQSVTYALRHKYYQVRYRGAAPIPDQLIFVDPTTIDRMVLNTSQIPISMAGTRIVDGDWDRNQIDETFMSRRQLRNAVDQPGVTPLENYGFFIAAKKHFEDGVPWENTDFYTYKLQSNEGGHYATKEALEHRLTELDELYQYVQEDGYMSQRVLRKLESSDHPLEPDRLPSPPEYGEVAVAIGRDGEIFFVDGRHRLAVARSIGVEEIPVRVVARHKLWQNIRQEYISTPFNQEVENNPDLNRLNN